MPAAIGRSAATLGLERAMLVSLALVLSLAACQEPEAATGPSMSQAALPNSITLTYICGNSFRVRNTNPEAITVTWDVYQQGETGTLVLPPKPASAPYSETYFTTVKKGTVRLFLDGVLKQTKANGNKPACELPVDTTRPPMPTTGLHNVPLDSSIIASPPGDTVTKYYRNVFGVRFADSTSGATIRQFLALMNGEIIGAALNIGEYVIRFPDPGPEYSAVDSLQYRIESMPGVEYAVPLAFRSGSRAYGRYPIDGVGAQRTDWISHNPTDFTRPRLQVRAPLAWGCETGAYKGARPAVGVVDYQMDKTLADFAALMAAPFEPTLPAEDMGVSSPLQDPSVATHGTGVAAIIVGRGDDGQGLAGMIWDAQLSFFALTANGMEPKDISLYFADQILPEASRRGVRVLVSSVGIGASNRGNLKRLSRALAAFADSGGLFIQATGDGEAPLTVASLLAISGNDYLAHTQAMASLFQSSPAAREHLLFVAGTETDGSYWTGGSFFQGVTEILAPATHITTLNYGGGVQTRDGTSFAAPFVGGVAALLLAMDPTLTASQVKDYLVRGAALGRVDPTTGRLSPDSLVEGVPFSEHIHQLDAYGSLKLLSESDPTTPICGFPVITSFVTNPETNELETVVRLARPNHYQSVYQGNVENVTVAQGGRRIGIDNYEESRNIDFLTTSWTVGSPLAFRGYRQFLERDTAFTDYATWPPMVTIRGGGSPRGPFDLCAGVSASLPAYGTDCYLGPIGISGGYAQVTVERSNYDVTGCGPDRGFYGSYLVPIAASGAPVVLREVHFEPCAPTTGAWTMPGEDAVAWRADGAVAWVAQSDASYLTVPGVPDPNDPNSPPPVTTTTEVHTTFRQVSVEPGLTVLGERTVNNRFSYALGWQSDASTLISYEYIGLGWSECKRIVRAGLAPQIELPNSAGPVPWCGNAVMEPLAAPRLMARLAGALSARSAAAPSGPALATRTRAEDPRKRTVQPIVLVN